ncbi:hypothetical protein [Streptomyces platensis]|uniref:hypothetical protein n=1 Tax=Streptomyces platensis TaxID=58346 RepID=UPI003864EA1F|nr:hypothetical protein OG962_36990 [Streptomyces platensis]
MAAFATTFTLGIGPAHAEQRLQGTWRMHCMDDSKTVQAWGRLEGSGRPYARHKLRISLMEMAADGRAPFIMVQVFNRDGSLTNYRKRYVHGGKGRMKTWNTTVQSRKGIDTLSFYATSRNGVQSRSCTDELPRR